MKLLNFSKAISGLSLVILMVWVVPALAATPAGTVITSQATADYNDANGNPATRILSNIVSTTVTAVAGVSVTPPTASTTAAVSATATFSFSITNLGNATDTYDLTSASSSGWTAVIVEDLNANGIWESNETAISVGSGELLPGESGAYHLRVDIPSTGVSDGAQELFTVTSASQLNPTVTADGDYTITVKAAVIELTKTITETTSYAPGDIVIYKIDAANSGDAAVYNSTTTDPIPANTTYVPGSMRHGTADYGLATPLTDADDTGLPGGDTAKFDISTDTIVIGPGTVPANSVGDTIFFKVQINEDTPAGQAVFNVATETFYTSETPLPEDGPFTSDSNTALFSVAAEAAVLITPTSQALIREPSELVAYSITVTNAGNATDTINLSTVSTEGWTWTLYNQEGSAQAGQSQPLIDTNGDGIVDTGPLTAGNELTVAVAATIPSGVANGSVDTTSVTGIPVSDKDNQSARDTVTLVTTINAAIINMVKSVLPTDDQPPGTILTYSVTSTNTGDGTARQVKINDPIPEWTTYQAESITTASGGGTLTSRTDANDGDGAYFDAGSGAVKTDPTDIGPGGSRTLEFKVSID